MATSIGSQTVAIMRGRPDAAAEVVEVLPRRPGEDAFRARKHGLTAAETPLATIAPAADLAAAEALETAYKALQGTYQTITDAHGTEHANCLIEAVRLQIRPVNTGAGGVYWVYAWWTVRRGPAA